MKKALILAAGATIGHFGGELIGAMANLEPTTGLDWVDAIQILLSIASTLLLLGIL